MDAENSWQLQMYDKEYANSSIASDEFFELAKRQVCFLTSVLNLEDGANILDVPCGAGRHSVLFAQQGYRVTGVDISEDCIRIAKSKFFHQNAEYVCGDMSKLQAYSGQFDVVMNLYTSFGYFNSDKENESVLKQMVDSLKPGGQFVLNVVDRDWLMKVYQPARWTEDNGIMTLEASRYDSNTRYYEAQMIVIDKQKPEPVLKHQRYHRLRLYSKSEILSLMKKAGLNNLQVFGDFDGSDYSKGKSSHPIYIGTRCPAHAGPK